MNIDLILEARNKLENTGSLKHCFALIDKFYEHSTISKTSLVYQLRDHLRILKSRYNKVESDKKLGIIKYEEYDITHNRILEGIYAFFDVLLEELEIDTTFTASQNTCKGILVLDKDFQHFTEEQAQKILEKIRIALKLEAQSFKYLYLKEGSVIIGFELIKDYSTIIKLKSLIKIGFIKDAVLLQMDNILLDRFFEIIVGFEMNFSNVYLAGANLSQAKLFGANLRLANLSKAILLGADLKKANLSKANLAHANLSHANLSKANLSNTDLSITKLFGAVFWLADLSGAKLFRAKLCYANLSGAKLLHTNFSKADLFGAKLSYADLSGAKLFGANLSKAKLSETDLSNADLSNANLSEADLSNAILQNSNFSNCLFFKTVFHIKTINLLQDKGVDISMCIFIGEEGQTVVDEEITI